MAPGTLVKVLRRIRVGRRLGRDGEELDTIGTWLSTETKRL